MSGGWTVGADVDLLEREPTPTRRAMAKRLAGTLDLDPHFSVIVAFPCVALRVVDPAERAAILEPAPFCGGVAFRDAVPGLCADGLTWQQAALRAYQVADPAGEEAARDREREAAAWSESASRPAASIRHLIGRRYSIRFPREGEDGVDLVDGEVFPHQRLGSFEVDEVDEERVVRRVRRRLFPILAAAFARSTPDWALASIGDLWLADARSLVAERPVLVRDRFFLRSADGRPLGEDPAVGDAVLLNGVRREVVSGAEHATHSYPAGSAAAARAAAG